MLPSANKFFETLPMKQCSKCGSVMEEQSECYMHVCEECVGGTASPELFDRNRLKPVE